MSIMLAKLKKQVKDLLEKQLINEVFFLGVL